MLLSDELKFIFVHVPKCGGTSLRNSLGDMPGVGNPIAVPAAAMPFTNDRNHLQMRHLKAYYPDTFAKFERYDSFAIARDPVSRFPSSLVQHHKMFHEGRFEALSLGDVRDLTAQIVARLKAGDAAHDKRLIHFERQTSFTHLDDEQIVANVFRLNNLDGLAGEVARRTGYAIPSLNDTNKAHAFRSAPARALRLAVPRSAKAVLRRHLPLSAKRAIDRVFFRPVLGDKMRDAILTPKVRAFIEDFYERDFELHAHAK
jgi:hypothetical protein